MHNHSAESDWHQLNPAMILPWQGCPFSRDLRSRRASRGGASTSPREVKAFMDMIRNALLHSKACPAGALSGAEHILARLRSKALRQLSVRLGLPRTGCPDEVHLDSVDSSFSGASSESWPEVASKEREDAPDSPDEDFRAFQRMLPALLKEHRGEFALIINGKLIRTDPDEFALLKYAYSAYPDNEGLIQPIQEEPPVVEVGGAKYLVE